jgi:adenylate kinase family enzyme
MRRIAVIGPAGSGKSWLARRLSDALGIRIVHLDKLYWKPGWVATPPGEWETLQRRELRDEPWIVEGLHEATMHLWLEAADAIVFLDVTPLACLWRVTRRRLDSEEDVNAPEGCEPAPFPHALLKFVRLQWEYRKSTRGEILLDLQGRRDGTRVFVLRTRGDVHAFLGALTERREPPPAGAPTYH